VDPKLAQLRNKLIPTFIEEEEFWKNYFYQVETIKAQLGLQNKLG
jgi:hypothetical protein